MKTAIDQARAIVAAARTDSDEMLVTDLVFEQGAANQLLFFFKPECFLLPQEANSTAVVKLGLEKFSAFGARLSGILVLSGRCLEATGIMDRHYGYINKISRRASQLVAPEEHRDMSKRLGVEPRDYEILGGHECLARFGDLDGGELDRLWASKPSIKLRSGFYFQAYEFRGQQFILVNGFHPAQLRHYTDPRHRIAVGLLHSETAWSRLRDEMIGDTFPERARAESLRGSLLARRNALQLPEVSVAANYCHLSAGPFEAFFEIWNFLTEVSALDFDLTETNIYPLLRHRGLSDEEIRGVLSNPTVESADVSRDLFSLTEGKDTQEAIDLLMASASVER